MTYTILYHKQGPSLGKKNIIKFQDSTLLPRYRIDSHDAKTSEFEEFDPGSSNILVVSPAH